MENDQFVAWPSKFPVGGAGTSGDNVIYSNVRDSVPGQDPGDIRGARRLKGWYKADQASTFAVQVLASGTWQTGTWVTINNAGAGVSVGVGEICDFNVPRPQGNFRIIVNFAVAPSAGNFNHSNGITLSPDAAQEVTQ